MLAFWLLEHRGLEHSDIGSRPEIWSAGVKFITVYILCNVSIGLESSVFILYIYI